MPRKRINKKKLKRKVAVRKFLKKMTNYFASRNVVIYKNLNNPVPREFKAKFKLASFGNIPAGIPAGSEKYYAFCLNIPYQPFTNFSTPAGAVTTALPVIVSTQSANGLLDYWQPTLNTLYRKCRIDKVSVVLRVSPYSGFSNTGIAMSQMVDNDVSNGSFSTLSQNPDSARLDCSAGNPKDTIKRTFIMHKLFGIPTSEYNANDAFKSEISNVGALVPPLALVGARGYCLIYTRNMTDVASDHTVPFQITVYYDVTFQNPSNAGLTD